MERMPLFESGDGVSAARGQPIGAATRRVFVVHGHDKGPREAVARLLSRLELTPVILEEEPNQGRTIIEKFEASADVAFAVVVMTPDDLGKAALDPGDPVPRSRQNVILELGFFIGLLGRHRVAAIVVGSLELPSDVSGVLTCRTTPAGSGPTRLRTRSRPLASRST